MITLIQSGLPYAVLAAQIALVFFFLAILARRSWGKGVFTLVGSKALLWGFLLALGAVSGSLFYSEMVGYEPCVLCWWQRVFIYPQLVLFAIALWKKDRGVFKYSAALASLAGVVALYHSYVYMGGTSLLPCTALGGACSKIYVYEFGGLVTIPSMSLTIVLSLLLLAWANRLYVRSH